jgi:hypothetical protein
MNIRTIFYSGSHHEIAYSLIIFDKFINGLLGANAQINITFQCFPLMRMGSQHPILSPVELYTLYFVNSSMHF